MTFAHEQISIFQLGLIHQCSCILNYISREKIFDKIIYVTNKYSFTRDDTEKKKVIQTIHFLGNFFQEFARNEICIERKFSIFDRMLRVAE